MLACCRSSAPITVFGTPLEITLSELSLEAFYPADAETAAALEDAGYRVANEFGAIATCSIPDALEVLGWDREESRLGIRNSSALSTA